MTKSLDLFELLLLRAQLFALGELFSVLHQLLLEFHLLEIALNFCIFCAVGFQCLLSEDLSLSLLDRD